VPTAVPLIIAGVDGPKIFRAIIFMGYVPPLVRFVTVYGEVTFVNIESYTDTV
jgi:hypothetical protein